jgi:hypothetical protein
VLRCSHSDCARRRRAGASRGRAGAGAIAARPLTRARARGKRDQDQVIEIPGFWLGNSGNNRRQQAKSQEFRHLRFGGPATGHCYQRDSARKLVRTLNRNDFPRKNSDRYQRHNSTKQQNYQRHGPFYRGGVGKSDRPAAGQEVSGGTSNFKTAMIQNLRIRDRLCWTAGLRPAAGGGPALPTARYQGTSRPR